MNLSLTINEAKILYLKLILIDYDFMFQPELCRLRQYIANTENKSFEEIQNDFTEIATCIRHNKSHLISYQNSQANQTWLKQFLKG